MIYTDDRDYADVILPGPEPWIPYDVSVANPNLHHLIKSLYLTGPVFIKMSEGCGRWTHLFVVKHASSSHFDHLIELSQKENKLPDGILCLAGSGRNFHGQRQRPWAAIEGNIHLAAYLSPRRIIKNFHSGFPILAAVSLIDALDAFEPLRERAKIKWVNDILIDGAKVAGFLVHTQSLEDKVLSAILGIGLNVEKTPRIKADAFVPKVACLRDFYKEESGLNQAKVLFQLLRSLANNYDLLLNGHYETLLLAYRERSIVLGHRVKIMSDTPRKKSQKIASGTVVEIGENLELILKGHQEPVTSGRLILT